MPLTPKLPDFKPIIGELNRSKSTIKIGVGPGFYRTLNKELAVYKQLPELFRPALQKIGDYVRMEMIPRTFEAEGPGWAPLSRRTVSERVHWGHRPFPILQRTGDLMRSLTQKSHPNHVEIIKVGKYARIEIGASSQKFVENQMGKAETNLPARPMIPGVKGLPLPDRDRLAMQGIIRKSLNDRIKRQSQY